MAKKRNVLIVGSGGRDFHNFNTHYRDDEAYNVVGFTAGTQIPGISDRKYPPELAGKLYPKGIPVYYEGDLATLIPKLEVDDVAFLVQQRPVPDIITLASISSQEQEPSLLRPNDTRLKSEWPVIRRSAPVQDGASKSQSMAHVRRAASSHAPPRRSSQSGIRSRTASLATRLRSIQVSEVSNLEKAQVHDRGDGGAEPHIDEGNIVYAGVDYAGHPGAGGEGNRRLA